jgi:diguanylate cyclase (GGDEF)-like protein/PAS domain S-box-containing protein
MQNLPTPSCVTDTVSDHAHQALRTSECRYRRLFETAQDGILLLNADTAQIEDVNPYLIELLGYSHAEFLGKKLWEVGSFADIAQSKEMFAELQTKGYVRYDDLPLKTKEGARIQVEFVSNSYDCGGTKVIQCNIRNITERKRVEGKIYDLAYHDSLTQLPNRRHLKDRLEQTMVASKRSGRYGALMFLDMDNFKPLNDTHGHDVGDLLLVEVARRISSCVREMDIVARFGGDEFMVMLAELDVDKDKSATQAAIVAEKIRAFLAEPYVLKFDKVGTEKLPIEHHFTSSIGVVMFINHDGSADDIVKWADLAMYRAKNAGRNLIRFYDSNA